MTRVSIGIPTYNRAGFLDETIESLLAQDWPDLEIIVVDDGSTDDTPRVLERWSERASNIRVHRQVNRGEASASNEAWQRATGTLFGVICSDDPQPPNLVKSTVAFLAARPAVIVSYPDWWYLDAEGRRTREKIVPEFSSVRLLGMVENFVGPGAFIRRDLVFSRLPRLRDPQFKFVSDYRSWIALAELGPFARLPETVAAWREHAGGASAIHRTAMAEELVRLFQQYFARTDLPPDVRALRSLSLANVRLAAAGLTHDTSRWTWANHLLVGAWYTSASGLVGQTHALASRLLASIREHRPLAGELRACPVAHESMQREAGPGSAGG